LPSRRLADGAGRGDSNLFSLNQSRGENADQVASAAFLESMRESGRESEANHRDPGQMVAGDRVDEAVGRYRPGLLPDPLKTNE